MQTLQSQQERNHCPVCDSTATTEFIAIHDVPVFCNVLWDCREEALNAARGNIDLLFCHTCGHVFNGAFEPDRMKYTPRYKNPLHYSPTFQKYMLDLAHRLVTTYDLHGKDIIEIGCGQGDFMRLLAEIGQNRCIGFDPSSNPQRSEPDFQSNRFTVIQDYYSEQYASYHADFIACRQVLEHVMEPKRFMESIRRAVAGKDDPLIFVEVPNVMFTLKKSGIWDLIYEHCGYFTSLSLNHLFVEAGLYPVKVDESFGGQFLCIEAKPSMDKKKSKLGLQNLSIQEVEIYVHGFADYYRKKIREWEEFLAEMRRSGIKPVVWGGGSKGITFLNVLKSDGVIDYLVDINPYKQGLYVPGTGQQVVSPDMLAEIDPQVVIVMNPLYMHEVKKMIAERQVGRDEDLQLIPAS